MEEEVAGGEQQSLILIRYSLSVCHGRGGGQDQGGGHGGQQGGQICYTGEVP